nr:hypothetical protein Iba_chr14bCG15760 [Ipomoea batatas]
MDKGGMNHMHEHGGPLLGLAGIRPPGHVYSVAGCRFRSRGSGGVVVQLQLHQGKCEPCGGGAPPDRHVRPQNRAGVYADAGRDVIQRRGISGGHRRTHARVFVLRESGLQQARGEREDHRSPTYELQLLMIGKLYLGKENLS